MVGRWWGMVGVRKSFLSNLLKVILVTSKAVIELALTYHRGFGDVQPGRTALRRAVPTRSRQLRRGHVYYISDLWRRALIGSVQFDLTKHLERKEIALTLPTVTPRAREYSDPMCHMPQHAE